MSELTGSIEIWDDEKGYGFIRSVTGAERLFVHITDYSRRHRRPEVGLAVRFKLSRDNNGRERAIAVRPVSGHRPEKKVATSAGGNLLAVAVLWVAGFGVLMVYLQNQRGLPPLIPLLYLLLAGVTFILYWLDKRAARAGRWRTPEITLHVWSLLGGWPGAMLAQGIFRHKSSKRGFRRVFWLTVLVNLGGLGYLATHEGDRWLRNTLPYEVRYPVPHLERIWREISSQQW